MRIKRHRSAESNPDMAQLVDLVGGKSINFSMFKRTLNQNREAVAGTQNGRSKNESTLDKIKGILYVREQVGKLESITI